MPADSLKDGDCFLSREELLSDDELVAVVEAFVGLGVGKVRLTGGEPLLRPGFAGLVERLAQVSGVNDLSMTTNAVLLPKLARPLREAGLSRITVSLDSLDETVFAQMSGGQGSATQVLEGIAAAEAAGFKHQKINCVVQRGANDHTVMDLLEYFRGTGHTVRLIEFLDVGSFNGWEKSNVVPGAEWLERIRQRWPLREIGRSHAGETAMRYAYEDGAGEIGLINSITQPFCGDCSRARVTADGSLFTCLFSGQGTPLRPALRQHPDKLRSLIWKSWAARTDRYSETRHLGTKRGSGLEMFRMGG
jgi:cyclic pyranopterin phosphate synthase